MKIASKCKVLPASQIMIGLHSSPSSYFYLKQPTKIMADKPAIKTAVKLELKSVIHSVR
jgi:hypothetical protein